MDRSDHDSVSASGSCTPSCPSSATSSTCSSLTLSNLSPLPSPDLSPAPQESVDYFRGYDTDDLICAEGPTEDNGAITQDMNVVAVDGSEADTEWSDAADEGNCTDHTTETLTASDIEKDLSSSDIIKVNGQAQNGRETRNRLQMNMKPRSHRRCHTVPVVLHGRHDAADLIMDKIDKELFKMTKVSNLQEKRSKLNREQRDFLRQQGVEFDTGDETVAEKPSLQESLAKLRSNKSFEKTPDEGDTGLGSVEDPGSEAEAAMPTQIVGKADVYSRNGSESSEEEEERKETYAEIDSDSAKQLDEKYKLIMTNKKGDSLKELKLSEQGSIRTEDFEAKFNEMCIPPVSKPSAPNFSKSRRTDSLTDLESIKTEDIEKEYRKTLITDAGTGKIRRRVRIYSSKYHDAGPVKRMTPRSSKTRSSKAQVTMTMPSKKKRMRNMRQSQPNSDIESIKTEDFENQFQSMVVKQVANVPITTFDRFIVDSDLDTITTQVIRDKFLSALNKSCIADSEPSSDAESRIDTLVEQKIQEILQKVKSSGDYSDLDSVRAYQGSPVFRHIEEESEEEANETTVHSVSRSGKLKKSSRRSPSIQRRKVHHYDDGLDLGDEAQEIERQSAQIRKELESEGWHTTDRLSSPSPRRSRTPTLGASRTQSPSTQVTHSGFSYNPGLSRSFTSLPTHLEMDPSLKLRDVLSKLQLEIIRTKKEQQMVNQSLEQAKEKLKEHQLEIKAAEKQVKENRTKAENARSELMLIEFKRDSARKEVEHLREEVKKKRAELELFLDTEDTTDGSTSAELTKLRDLKLSRTEVAKMLAEREEFLKKQESLERQYKELESQLAAAKNSIINDQKASRQREDTLREELEACEAKLQEANTECDVLQKKVETLESEVKWQQEHQETLLRKKCAEYEDLKMRLQEQMAELKHAHSQEVAELRKQLTDVTEKLSRANMDLKGKDETIMKLQEQVLSLQTKLSEQTELISTLRDENKKCAVKLQEEKDNAITQLKQRAEEDKNHALDELAQELEHQHNLLISQAEMRFRQELSELQGQLTARDLELEVMRDKLKQQESMGKQLADQIRSEANIRFRQLVQEERSKWEQEKEQEINRQLAIMREEMEKTAKQLRQELTAERQLVDSQLKQIMELKKELEAAKIQNRQAIREKLLAYSHARDNADYDKERQMDIIRERMEEESHHSVERLRDTIHRLEDELDRLRKENKELVNREQEVQSAMESHDRAILNEINDECRKIASVIGITPRVVTFSSYSLSGKSGKNPMKAAVGTALSNLRNSSEELRSQMKELKQEMDALKQSIRTVEKEKKEAVDHIKHKMQKEKLKALETLKDRLIKEHLEEVDKLHKSLGKGKSMHKALRQKDSELQEIQINMKKWKNETTERLAAQFQEEMSRELEKRMKEYKKQQREWERERISQQRELQRLERELQLRTAATDTGSRPGLANRTTQLYGTPLRAMPPAVDSDTARMVKHLQGKVKLLETENTSLKHSKKLSNSTPDLQNFMSNSSFADTSKADDHMIRQLEVQLERTENRLKLTEERAEKNESLLNQKLLELSKLQSTLTQQTKELMQLERAYSQLQQRISLQSGRLMMSR